MSDPGLPVPAGAADCPGAPQAALRGGRARQGGDRGRASQAAVRLGRGKARAKGKYGLDGWMDGFFFGRGGEKGKSVVESARALHYYSKLAVSHIHLPEKKVFLFPIVLYSFFVKKVGETFCSAKNFKNGFGNREFRRR